MGIKEYLDNIKKAVKGEEVRGSIHDAIKQCYDDATGNPESIAAAVRDIEKTKEEIHDTVENYKSEADQKIAGYKSETDQKVAESDARISEAVKAFNIEGLEKVLWTGTLDGSGQTITLSDPVTDFDYIDFYHDFSGKIAIQTFSSKETNCWIKESNVGNAGDTSSFLQVSEIGMSVLDNKVSIPDNQYVYWYFDPQNGVTTPTRTYTAGSGGRITKIVGRKLVNNAEVLDLRVGDDGKIYESAGDAVRGQVSGIYESIRDIQKYNSYDVLSGSKTFKTRVNNGITFEVGDDISECYVHGTATATAYSYYYIGGGEFTVNEGDVFYLEYNTPTDNIGVSFYFYDSTNTYKSSLLLVKSGEVKIPSGIKYLQVRLQVANGKTVDARVKVVLLTAKSNKELLEIIKDYSRMGYSRHVVENSIDVIYTDENVFELKTQNTIKVQNKNLYIINGTNKNINGASFVYDNENGSFTASATNVTSSTIEYNTSAMKCGSINCHWAMPIPEDTWVTFSSNPNREISFDEKIAFQIYKNGTMLGYERGLGYTFKVNAGDTIGFRAIAMTGWSGEVTFYPQLEIGLFRTSYEKHEEKQVSNIDKISLWDTITLLNCEGTEFYYKEKNVKHVKKKPMLSFVDDDTTSVNYVRKFHDAFEGTGTVGTYAVMTRRITDGGQDMDGYKWRYDNEGELLNLLKQYEMEGFGMVYHCWWQNDAHQSTRYFTLEQRDISKARENLVRGLREYKELGFFNSNLWVTPYGVMDEEIQNIAKEVGLDCVVSMANNTIISDDYRNRYTIPRYALGKTTDLDAIKTEIRTAHEKGGWITIVTHVNDWTESEYPTLVANIKELINFSKSIGVDVVPFAMAFNTWKSAMYEAEAYK